MHISTPVRSLLLSGLLLASVGACVQAQERYFPLDHRGPTGMAGRWSALTQPAITATPQLVEITLPAGGTVTFYPGSPHSGVPLAAPARAVMAVGYVYRFRISDLPRYPGVELYPTVEILDRLNPPPGLEEQFPVPIELTEAEIETALQDRMVTKVIYLEHPHLAIPKVQVDGLHTESVSPSMNLMQAADLRGRPMALIRIGGRIPDPRSPVDEFYSQSPISVLSRTEGH